MAAKAWKKIGADYAKLFRGEFVREPSMLERMGMDHTGLFGDYRPSSQFIANEVAFTQSLRNEEPDLKTLGYYMKDLFSDQTYRWN